METFVIRLVRGGAMAGDGTGGTAGGEVHGVLSRVMDGSEFKFRSGDELIELLQTPPPGPDAA